jgi:hypothetical protein
MNEMMNSVKNKMRDTRAGGAKYRLDQTSYGFTHGKFDFLHTSGRTLSRGWAFDHTDLNRYLTGVLRRRTGIVKIVHPTSGVP